MLLVSATTARFLDNVVTQTIAAEGGGLWREYVGGYADWLAAASPGRGAEREPREMPAPLASEAAPS